MDRSVDSAFKFNQESEFVPIAGLVEEQLNSSEKAASTENQSKASSIQDNHHSALLAVLSEELSVSPEEIHDFELYVFSAST